MKSFFITSRLFHILFLSLLLGGALYFRSEDNAAVRNLRFMAFDTYNKIYPRASSDKVVIADIDETSLQDDRMGQWPWPRHKIAALIDKLTAMGAKAIAFDMVFAEEDRTSPSVLIRNIPADHVTAEILAQVSNLESHDDILAKAFRDSGRVVTGFTLSQSALATRHMPTLSRPILMKNITPQDDFKFLVTAGVTTNILSLEQAAAGNGSFGVFPESDGVIRQVPLFFALPQDVQDPQAPFYPSLAMESLRVAQNAKSSHRIRALKESELKGLQAPYVLNIGAYNIPFDRDARFYVQFDPYDPSKYIPIWDIMNDKADPRSIKDKIVLIGTSAEGLRDIRTTPLNPYIPGVDVHRNIIEQAMEGRFLARPKLVDGVEILFTAVVALLVILCAPFINAVLLGIFTILLVGGVWFASLTVYLDYGLLVDPVYPSLTIFLLFLLATLLTYIRTESERAAVKQAFGLYISPDYMKELARNPDQLRLGGEMRDISVMFTDVRGFTSISEQLTPDELIQLMNDFLTPMSDCVMAHQGTIDKYMGDAMMAFWNAPLTDVHHARHACQAALEMKAALHPLNTALAVQAEKSGRVPLVIKAGIGINSGPGAVGNMGSKQRFAYSVLGDTVNLASRLEGQTKSYGVEILIGEATAAQVEDFAIIELDKIRVKGKQEPVRVYTLLDDAQNEAYRRHIIAHNVFLKLYRTQEWDAALAQIDICVVSGDGALAEYYAIMRGRIDDLKKTTPHPDWDGVYQALSK
jgi:adenylate cyclase